jgi:hypothetical protein
MQHEVRVVYTEDVEELAHSNAILASRLVPKQTNKTEQVSPVSQVPLRIVFVKEPERMQLDDEEDEEEEEEPVISVPPPPISAVSLPISTSGM